MFTHLSQRLSRSVQHAVDVLWSCLPSVVSAQQYYWLARYSLLCRIVHEAHCNRFPVGLYRNVLMILDFPVFLMAVKVRSPEN
jgi:hypothetical protein